MGHVSVSWALVILALMIVGSGVMAVMLPTTIAGQPDDRSGTSSNTDAPVLEVSLEQTPQGFALPGEIIEYTATIENKSDEEQTNLRVIMAVSEYAEALVYVSSSTSIRRTSDGRYVPLGAQLSTSPINIAETLMVGQVIAIKWRLQVSECALRNRWTQVAFRARTDDSDPELGLAYKNLLIAPHTDLVVKKFTVVYDLNTPSPAPGDPVHHTVQVVNTGTAVLDDIIVHLAPHETLDRFLPTVAQNSAFTVLPGRGMPPKRTVAIDPKWSNPTGGFTLKYLNADQVLVMTWTDYVADDAPIGTEVMPHVWIRVAGSTEWVGAATRFIVSEPRNDVAFDIRTMVAGSLTSSYFPGEVVTMRVAVTNHTQVVQDDLRVSLDLPFALSHIGDSARLSTADFLDGNARRLSGTWIRDGAVLPALPPDGTVTVTFETKIGESVSPQDGIETRAILHDAGSVARRAVTRLNIVGDPDIEMTVGEIDAAKAGEVVPLRVDVSNTGRATLTDVTFGFEETCGMSYVPGSLKIEGAEFLSRDDGPLLNQLENGEDPSIAIGVLEAGGGVQIKLRVRIEDQIQPGMVAGPRFVAVGQSAETPDVPFTTAREETEIEVVESIAKAVDSISESVAEAADSISPFARGIRWFSQWAISGVLASFVAGLVLPFTLWRAALWLNARVMVDGRDIALSMVVGFVNLARPVWAVVGGCTRVRHHLRERIPFRRSNKRGQE